MAKERSGWRIAVTMPFVLTGALGMLFLDVLQGLVYEVRKALFGALTTMIEWAGARDSDGSPKGEKPQALSAQHDSAGPKDIAQNGEQP